MEVRANGDRDPEEDQRERDPDDERGYEAVFVRCTCPLSRFAVLGRKPLQVEVGCLSRVALRSVMEGRIGHTSATMVELQNRSDSEQPRQQLLSDEIGNQRIDIDMIDDILAFVFDIVLDFVPTIVWKLLLFVIGIVLTAVGVTLLDNSPQTGSALILVGMVLLVGLLVSLAR